MYMVNVKCVEDSFTTRMTLGSVKIYSNDASDSMYTLCFARYCRDLCGFGCMGELCGFVVARIM